MNYLNLPIGARAPEIVNAVVEIPGRQANKYEYDKTLGVFRLDRPLYASVRYPGEYGFIPRTRASDDDPLDILILLQDPTFPGCLIETRPIGVLEMVDQKVQDQKILAVAASSPTHKETRSHTDLASHVLREIEHFFSVYKDLEGKHTEVRGWNNSAHARKLIAACHERFKTKEGFDR